MIKNTKSKTEKNDKPKGTGLKSVIINFLYNYFNIIVVFIVVLVLISGFFFLIRPKYRAINDNISSVNEAKSAEKEDMENYLNKLKVYRTNYNSINNVDKDKINTMLPQGGEVEKVIAEMENLVVNKGMLLSQLKVSLDQSSKTSKAKAGSVAMLKPSNVGTINIEMNIEGVDYRGLKMLLDTIERNLRILDITDMNFSPGSETVSLEIATYYLKSGD